jgi:hypothetical protein
MPRTPELNFIQQQGFEDANAGACELQYPALMFQPRILGFLVAIGTVFQLPGLFLILWVVLWWSSLVPRLNPFDAVYNGIVAEPKGLPRLAPAPGPRRFAQGTAGSFMLVIGLSLIWEWTVAAWVFEGLLIAALCALIFGKFCIGSYAFLLINGKSAFANRTLPWIRRD